MARFAILTLLFGLVAAEARASAQNDPAAPPASKASEDAGRASADEAAIQALVAEFVRAFNAGDAQAVAALFADDARVVSEEGRSITGRAAIEQRFAEGFESAPGRTIAIETESLRMLGSDAAIEEGVAVVTTPAENGGDARAERSRFLATYVKRNGKWLQEGIHDFQAIDEHSAHERLKELEWLVGEWVDEDDEGEVHTVCEWSEDGSFLLRRYRLKVQGEFVMSGVQRIGWDPRRKQFRSWVFDSEGGFSDGLWARDGDRWIVKTDGVLQDGRSVSATNVITRLGPDLIRWASISRILDGAVLADAEDVILARRPPEPSLPSPDSTSTEQPPPGETPR